jgi:hypothetical protein
LEDVVCKVFVYVCHGQSCGAAAVFYVHCFVGSFTLDQLHIYPTIL